MLNEQLRTGLHSNGFASSIVVLPLGPAAFRYEEFGAGTLEYVYEFSLREGADRGAWESFITSSGFWSTIDLVTPLEAGILTIQQEWNAIRNHIQASIDKIGSRFYSLERFLSTRFNLVPVFRSAQTA